MGTTRRILKAASAQEKEEELQTLVESTESDYFDNDEKPPLVRHIEYFGGNQEEGISFTSIKNKNLQLGDGSFAATTNAALVSGASGAKIKGCPFSKFKAKDAIGILNHPQSSGIFNLDGTLNEHRWNHLLTYTQQRVGKSDIITEKRFYEFLNSCRQLETRSDPFKMGLMASNGEWKAFFDKFAAMSKAGTRYVTVERLRKFFEDSAQVGLEVEQEISLRKQFR